MSAATFSYDGTLVLADGRTAAAEIGFVDCFLCGHKVDILRAFRIQTEVGPEMYMHSTCKDGFTPRQIWLLYNLAVRGVGRNHGYNAGKDADLLVRLR